MSAETWKITLVHGNDHVREGTAENYPEALKWAEDMEREIHDFDSENPFDELRETFTHGEQAVGYVQFGTNYHYVVFEGPRP